MSVEHTCTPLRLLSNWCSCTLWFDTLLAPPPTRMRPRVWPSPACPHPHDLSGRIFHVTDYYICRKHEVNGLREKTISKEHIETDLVEPEELRSWHKYLFYHSLIHYICYTPNAMTVTHYNSGYRIITKCPTTCSIHATMISCFRVDTLPCQSIPSLSIYIYISFLM